MSQYPYLQQIPEPQRTVLRMLIDQVGSLAGREDGGPSWRTTVNAGGNGVVNAADGVEDDDLATVRQVEAVVLADTLRARLEAGGDAELNVSGLAGVLGEPQKMGITVLDDAGTLPNISTAQPYEVVSWQGKLYYFSPLSNPGKWVPLAAAASIVADTHANRLVLYLPANQPLGLLFWETDRTALYRVISTAGVKAWSLMMSRPMRASSGSRPADLGTNDAGFVFVDQGQDQASQRWTGTAWQWYQGHLRDTFANRPAVGITDDGFQFIATDYGFQVWESTGAVWTLLEGVGGPMRGTIIAADQRPAGLTVNDNGFRFEATDAGITWRWLNGTGWVLQPNQILAGRLEMSVAMLLPTATPTTLVYGIPHIDQGPIISGSTFVVPVRCGGTPAVWALRAVVEWDASAAGVRTVEIQNNGVTIPGAITIVTPTAAADIIQEVTAFAFNPAAGDVFSVQATQTSGGDLNAETSFFECYRMTTNG